MSEPKRVALAGAGGWGRNIARSLGKLRGAIFFAVCDTDPKALAKPWTTTFYYQNRPDWELGEISCSGDYLDFNNFESFSFKKKEEAPK